MDGVDASLDEMKVRMETSLDEMKGPMAASVAVVKIDFGKAMARQDSLGMRIMAQLCKTVWIVGGWL